MPQRESPTNFARYPLLLLAACFSVGIISARLFEIHFILTAAILVIGVLAALCVPRIAAISLSIAFVLLGSICMTLEANNVRPDRLRRFYDEGRIASGTSIGVEGVVTNGPEPTTDGVVMLLRTSRIEHNDVAWAASGNARVYVLANTAEQTSNLAEGDIGYGSRIRIDCPLRCEENFQNPGVFSQVEMLDQQGIDAVCTVKDPSSIEVLSQTRLAPLRWVFDVRINLIDGFRRLMDPPTAGVMIASLLGDKYFVDRDTADVFRDGGTFHILVISGLHITFMGGLALLIIGAFTQRRVLSFLLAAGFLWAYTLAVGAEIPVVRASLMFTILLFSQIVRRDGTLLNSLGLCALILLVWRPQDIFTASFQLTFVSVAAIIGIALPLIEKLRAIGDWRPTSSAPFPPAVPKLLGSFCETLYWRADAWQIESKQNIWNAKIFKSPFVARLNAGGFRVVAAYVFEGLLVSTIVQISLLPLSVYYFHRVSFASIFLNLWVGVILAMETVFAVAAVGVAAINDTLAAPFAATAELFNMLLTSFPAGMMEFVSFSSRIPVYPGYGKLIYPLFGASIALAGMFLFKWRPFDLRPRRSAPLLLATIAISFVLGVVIILHPYSSPAPNGRLTVDFLDVGQGDSAFITFPNGKTMLIDGGGRFSFGRQGNFEPDIPRVGERVVSEFLWDKGLSRVDFLLGTHADADHMQGLADIARNFDVGQIYAARSEPLDHEFADLTKAISRQGANLEIVGKGDVISVGDATINVVHPAFDDTLNSDSDNDASLVVRITYGSRRFLFTGDIELEGERELSNDPDSLRSDVVKVAHHGSKTSSTQAFIDSTDPQIAVISVGRRSTFGHPHSDVVQRWKDSGARVMTTGDNGTITISTDGKDLIVSTFRKKQER